VPLADTTKLLADNREGYVLPAALAPMTAKVPKGSKGSLLTRGTIDAYIAAVIELWRL
jgi:hypothetical protein